MLAFIKKMLILYLIVVGVNTLSGNDKSPQDVLKSVRDTYNSYETVCAEYTKTFHWTLADETRQTSGRICTKRGKKFRITTSDQLIVTDGETLWTLNKMNNQVLVDYAKGEQDNPFLKSFYDTVLKQYSAEFCDEQNDDTCIQLHAKQETEFNQTVKLWIDKKYRIRKIERTDINDNRTVFAIENIDTNISLPDGTFIYEPESGQQIIDLR